MLSQPHVGRHSFHFLNKRNLRLRGGDLRLLGKNVLPRGCAHGRARPQNRRESQPAKFRFWAGGGFALDSTTELIQFVQTAWRKTSVDKGRVDICFWDDRIRRVQKLTCPLLKPGRVQPPQEFRPCQPRNEGL